MKTILTIILALSFRLSFAQIILPGLPGAIGWLPQADFWGCDTVVEVCHIYNSSSFPDTAIWEVSQPVGTYTYDSLCRLRSVSEGFGLNTSTWTYDSIGNLIYSTINGDFMHYEHSYSYNADNRLKEVAMVFGGVDTSSLTIYTYDNSGRLIEQVSLNYYQTPPDSTSKVNYTYHPGNFPPEIAEELYFDWNSSTSSWDTAYKYIYTDSSFGGTLNNPHPSRKKTRTYLNYNGFTNVWVNGSKFVEVWRDIDWINWKKTEEVWYNWDITDNAWIPNHKTSWGWGDMGGFAPPLLLSDTSFHWDVTSSSWQGNDMTTYNYDWSSSFFNPELFSTVHHYLVTDTLTNSNVWWPYSTRAICGTFVFTDIKQPNAPSPSVSIYPNPTSSSITIDNLRADEQIYITNSLGQLVHRSEFSLQSMRINLKQYGGGLYIVKVLNASGGSFTSKVIVQ